MHGYGVICQSLIAFVQFIRCHFLNPFHTLTFTVILSICHQFVEHSTQGYLHMSQPTNL